MTTRSCGGHRQHDLLLELAERHQHEPRVQLVPRQQRRELAHLLLRRARQNRIAVEVDEQHRQPRRIMRYAATGESMPPDSRHATRPLGAGRQPAGARAPCRRSRTRRRSASRRESSAPGRRDRRSSRVASLMRPPTSRSICGEVNGKRLSARRADTRNVARLPIAEVAQDRRGERVEVVRRRGRRARSSRCRTPGASRSRDLVPGRVRRRASISMRPITDRTAAHVETASALAEVPHEQLDEPRPVLPLEREFLVVNDDGVHRVIRPQTSAARHGVGGPVPAAHRALDRSGQAGVDPVAGEEEPGDRRARGGPRRLAGRQRERGARLADRPWPRTQRARRAPRQRVRAARACASVDQLVVRPREHVVGAARHERQVRRRVAEHDAACRTPTASRGRAADERLVHDRPVEPEVHRDDRATPRCRAPRRPAGRSSGGDRRRTGPAARTRAPRQITARGRPRARRRRRRRSPRSVRRHALARARRCAPRRRALR